MIDDLFFKMLYIHRFVQGWMEISLFCFKWSTMNLQMIAVHPPPPFSVRWRFTHCACAMNMPQPRSQTALLSMEEIRRSPVEVDSLSHYIFTWDVKEKPVNHGINYLSIGAGSLLSTVLPSRSLTAASGNPWKVTITAPNRKPDRLPTSNHHGFQGRRVKIQGCISLGVLLRIVFHSGIRNTNKPETSVLRPTRNILSWK